MEHNSLPSAIKKIAIGYLFIYLHINLGPVDILPDWAGYFMIVSALPVLAREVSSAKLLEPFGLALGVAAVVKWGLKIVDTEVSFYIISVLVGIIGIYFHFQLITNIANLDIEPSRRKRLLVLRTTTVILHTLLACSLHMPITHNEETYTYILMFMGIPQVIICFWIAGELFSLSKVLGQKENDSELPD